MMNTDTITVYKKSTDESWIRTVVHNVQWSDHIDKTTSTGRVTMEPIATITFFEGFDSVPAPFGEEDFIVYGECVEECTTEKGSRPSDIVDANVKSGFITSVNDNSNRDHLKNIKVVVSRG